MLINWFTVVAQIINFLLLVFLLWQFLYKPITKTMQKRHEHLKSQWEESQTERENAQREAESYRQKQKQLERERQELLAEAKEEAANERQELIKKARHEVLKKQEEWEESLKKEQDRLIGDLKEKITTEVYRIARHVLKNLADVELEKQIVSVFLHRLDNLDEKERETISTSNQQVQVLSSFNLSEEMQNNIINFLSREKKTDNVNVDFGQSQDLVCGIKLKNGDYEIAWNLHDYLENLEKHISINNYRNQKSTRNTESQKELISTKQ